MHRWLSFPACLLCLATTADAASDRAAPARSAIAVPEPSSLLGKCPPGQIAYSDGSSLTTKCIAAPACGPEQTRNAAGQCACPPGKIAVRHGAAPQAAQCIAAPPCAAGQTRDAQTGECRCPPGQVAYRGGSGGGAKCVVAKSCPPGTKPYWDGAGGGACVP